VAVTTHEPSPPPPDEELAMARREIAELKTALETRGQIGVALGMVMLRYGVGRERAFEYLSRRSQDTNTKLREVARLVIEELARPADQVGEPPTTDPEEQRRAQDPA
jgi:ANTAR domain-containing protein